MSRFCVRCRPNLFTNKTIVELPTHPCQIPVTEKNYTSVDSPLHELRSAQVHVSDIVLIATTDAKSGRSDALDRMLRSVEGNISARPDKSIILLLLLQNCSDQLFRSMVDDLPPFARAIPIAYRTSLSGARNALLSYARSAGLISPSTVVGFPDDDCWYSNGLLGHVADTFAADSRLGLWFCRYSSNPCPLVRSPVVQKQAKLRDVVRHSCSTAMFVRGNPIVSGRKFDENLGIGTANMSGEDTEFALQAHLFGGRSMYLPLAAIGHRDRDPRKRARYYRGGLIAIARHAKSEMRIAVELMRKLLVGVWLVLRRELPFTVFADAVLAAARSGRPASS